MPLDKNGSADFETELERLSQALAGAKEKKIDLVTFMHDSISLFEKIENCLQLGSVRDRDLAYRKLKELGSLVEEDIENVCKESGRTEEEMGAYVENPDNFGQEVWAAIQKANRHILTRKKSKRRPLSN